MAVTDGARPPVDRKITRKWAKSLSREAISLTIVATVEGGG